MTGDVLRRSAASLGRGIETGEIDPLDLAEAFLSAIAVHEAGNLIYARMTGDRARSEARAARDRARSGLRRSPLDGVPISWKDLFDTAGIATEAGSALLAGRVPGRDAAVLASATSAGLVCLGKTHMTELAFSGIGYNPVTATPPNVHDAARAPGGSSSGAAASVAFGLAAAGIGSDTGGSIRVPSAWNDLVGLKPGHGRLPLRGVVPLAPRFDTVGPLCRTVEDAALIFAAMGAGKPADLDGARMTGRRLGVLTTVALDGIEDAPKAGFENAVERLRAAGADIRPIESPSVRAAFDGAGPLFASEAYGTWRDSIEADPGKMFPAVLERFRGGRAFSGPDYVTAWQALEGQRADYRAATAGFDAILVPTCPILPPQIAHLEADADYFAERNLMTLRNTRIGNLMGLAVLTVPTGLSMTGLSLMGPPGSEERLLRLGTAVEVALT